MVENRIFYICIALSLFVHAIFVVSFSLADETRLIKKMKSVETVYHVLKKKPKQTPKTPKLAKLDQQKLIKNVDVLPRKEALPTSLMNSITKPSNRIETLKRNPGEISELLDLNRKVTVTNFRPQKINNPLYINYNESIRSGIRDLIVARYAQGDIGEVYLTFALMSDGTLTAVKLISERTQATDYLIQLGLDSIEQASPFPPFPNQLPYPELTFNIAISFRAKN